MLLLAQHPDAHCKKRAPYTKNDFRESVKDALISETKGQKIGRLKSDSCLRLLHKRKGGRLAIISPCQSTETICPHLSGEGVIH